MSNSNLNEYEDKPDLSYDESENAIRQFAEITDTDEAFAHFILQDVNYDIDRAMTKYFAFDNPEEVYRKFQQQDEPRSSDSPARKVPKYDDEMPGELTIITWNIDGTEKSYKGTRFNAVLYTIAKVNPEIIFLQEVVMECMPSLKQLLAKMYNIIVSDEKAPYFCVTLISKNIAVKKQEIINFPNTKMFRAMTCVTCQWQKLNLNLINTHLESLKESSEERIAQLNQCLQKMYSFVDDSNPHQNQLTIFGGDLNIRNSEMPKLLKDVKDAWETAGEPIDEQYTWDTRRNDNRKAGFARCRFDRILHSSGAYNHVEFHLQGTQRIRGASCFPSDHFAVVVRFRSPKAKEKQQNPFNF